MLTLTQDLDILLNKPTPQELSLLDEYKNFIESLNAVQSMTLENVISKRVKQKEIQAEIKRLSVRSKQNKNYFNNSLEIFKKNLSQEQLEVLSSIEQRATTLAKAKIDRQIAYREKIKFLTTSPEAQPIG